ncbi:MAG TPA: CDP-alcohol phosphatidyltransferase family protein [Gammaproteobacteria bacterium]|nr:CDP-alcohol phosphatidyltransferase family protein [Gammaproteobacteria bacterium]
MQWPSLKTTAPYTSWTHRLARYFVQPLVHTPVTPNHLTTLRFLSGLLACVAFGYGTRSGEIWGGVWWVVSAFMDRADGELARLSGRSSPAGHAYDYFTDVILNALLFLSIGLGLRHSHLGAWAVLLGLVAGIAVAVASVWSERLEKFDGSGRKAYTGVAGFDFDDALYLFGPLAWLEWLEPVLIAAAICSPVIALLTWRRLSHLRLLNAASGGV